MEKIKSFFQKPIGLINKSWSKIDLLEDNKIKLATFLILPWPLFLAIMIIFYFKKLKK